MPRARQDRSELAAHQARAEDPCSHDSPDKQRLLFLEFTRFDPGAAQGSGIGLAISQRIAHALGGAITVESNANVGSTFTLWLPLAPAGAEGLRAAVGSAT